MSSVFRFPYGGRQETVASLDEVPDGPADGNEHGELAGSQTQAPSETPVKTTETNGSKPNRSRTNSAAGSKRRPRSAPRGRSQKPIPPSRERVIVNGASPLEAAEETREESSEEAIRPVESTSEPQTNPAADERTDPPAIEDRVDELEDRLERLNVVCEAMWHLLSGEVGLSLDQLAAKIEERSLEQARLEEPPEPPEPESICPDCGETMPVGAKTCLFCSARSNGPALH